MYSCKRSHVNVIYFSPKIKYIIAKTQFNIKTKTLKMIRQDTDHTHHHKNNLFCPFIDILIIYLSLPEPLICSFLESNSMISVEISFSNSIVVWRFTLDVLCIRKIRKMYCMYSYFYFFSCSFFFFLVFQNFFVYHIFSVQRNSFSYVQSRPLGNKLSQFPFI